MSFSLFLMINIWGQPELETEILKLIIYLTLRILIVQIQYLEEFILSIWVSGVRIGWMSLILFI